MTIQISYAKNRSPYYSVLSDGKFHTEATEGAEGSVKREYETSDGKKGVKNEFIVESIQGKMISLNVHESDYGKMIQVTLGDEKEKIIISLNSASSFGEDFMKKLPLIDVTKEVKLVPYSFEDELGKKRKGVTIYQDDEKILSNYGSKVGEKYVVTNGYPAIPEGSDKFDTDDWKMYFMTARKFLLVETSKHSLYGAIAKEADKEMDYPENEVDPKDIPF